MTNPFWHKKLGDVEAFVAGDETILKEVLHPKNDPLHLPLSIAHASIPVGGRSLDHRLQQSDEIYIILNGKGVVNIDDRKEEIEAGSVFLIPKNALQSVENTGATDLVFYCIVTPPWNESEEIIED